jgi:hypothetical protein
MNNISMVQGSVLAFSSLLLVTASCRRERSAFEELLVNDRKCWKLYRCSPEHIDPNGISLGCTVFHNDGRFKVMSMDGEKYEDTKYFFGKDDDHKNEWSFSLKDSTIRIGSAIYNQFKVVSFSADTITLKTADGHFNTLVN